MYQLLARAKCLAMNLSSIYFYQIITIIIIIITSDTGKSKKIRV